MNVNCEVIDVLISLTVVIISQWMGICKIIKLYTLNIYNFCQFYLNTTGKK